jgi:hypothetical protein
MTRLTHLKVTVTLRAPWLVQGNDPGTWGLDAVQLRGPHGQRVLPGTLLLGRLRESWNELVGLDHCPNAEQWLGPRRDSDAGDSAREPKRSRLFVDDLMERTPSQGLATAEPSVTLPPIPSHRLKIDSATGAGEEGMLQFIEQREAPGAEITFAGTWRAWLTEAEATAMPNWIAKGLSWHTQLGAFRNIGFGAVVSAAVTIESPTQADEQKLSAFVAGRQHLPRGLILRFTQPLAVGNRLVNGNLFISSDVIPGAAIKGALATMLQAQGLPVPAWFDHLRITQARPSADGRRPAPLPLNLVAKDAEVWELRDNGLPMHNNEALKYSYDWKSAALNTARQRQSWGRTRDYLRVRTAIEGGLAADKSLFAYQCKVADTNPATSTGTESTTCWAATLDLPDSQATAWVEVAQSFSGGTIGPLGKTDAFAAVELVPGLAPVWDSKPDVAGDQEVHLLLTSDGLIFPSHSVQGPSSAEPGALLKVYAEAFQNIASATIGAHDGCLALTRFFATQRFAGGDYLRRRRPGQEGADYSPYVLTEAGSVFVFEIKDPTKAAALLALWQQHGLPLSAAVMKAHGGCWQTNPYLPQNGYGEVCVNPQHGFAALPRSNG